MQEISTVNRLCNWKGDKDSAYGAALALRFITFTW